MDAVREDIQEDGVEEDNPGDREMLRATTSCGNSR